MNQGFILVNKPAGPTSHDIVDRIRRITATKTVGHAGTLDPFATGLLIVGVGREATREFQKLVGLDKRYVATLRLGATSDTDDRTGRIAVYGQHTINNEQHVTDGIVQSPLSIVHIDEVLKKFTGKIMQVPPMYSAKKIKGKKLYELAREGKTVERAPVPIEVYSIEESKFQQPNSRKNPNTNNQIPNNSSSLEPDSLESGFLKLDIHCSSGTYIRGLARDIGAALGCGAYLEELERTAIGPFTLEEAITMDNLAKDGAGQHLLEVANILARAHR